MIYAERKSYYIRRIKQVEVFLKALIIYLGIVGSIVWLVSINWDGGEQDIYMKSMQGVIVAYESDKDGIVLVLKNTETDEVERFQVLDDSVCLEEVKYIIENRICGDDVISISYCMKTDYPAYAVYVAQLVPKETEYKTTENISSK